MSAPLILWSAAAVNGPVLAEAVKPGSPPPITFVVTALFAIAIFFLGFDLVRRLRRSRFRAEIRENLAAELAEREAVQQRIAENESAAPDAASEGSGPGEQAANDDTSRA